MARLDPQKDHENFFQAARLVAVQAPEAFFLLAGQGVTPANPEVANLVRVSGLSPSRLFLLGERHDMPRLTAALDVAVSASAFGEGFANTVGEAMACGVPCVLHALARLSRTQTALSRPAIALIKPDGVNATVFVLGEDDRVSLTEIETGNYAEGYIEVVRGLSEGARVVVSGQTYLQEGDRVREGDHELSPLYFPSLEPGPDRNSGPPEGN